MAEEDRMTGHQRQVLRGRRRAARSHERDWSPHAHLPSPSALGLEEVVEEPYLKYRIRSTAYLADKLTAAGVPIIQPAGGHAIYIDARATLPHIPPARSPGIALVNALYLEGGVRGVEIGTVMFGLRPDGTEVPPAMDLVRLAIPRRVYTQSHIDYVAEVVIAVAAASAGLRGYRIVAAPATLRHFTARFEGA
jgi:tryptophanase